MALGLFRTRNLVIALAALWVLLLAQLWNALHAGPAQGAASRRAALQNTLSRLGATKPLTATAAAAARWPYHDRKGPLGTAEVPAVVDVVYTWVNGSDPKHAAERALWKAKMEAEAHALVERRRQAAAADEEGSALAAAAAASMGADSSESQQEASLLGVAEDALNTYRFKDNNELRYSIRSVLKFAPWVRNIYVVTNGQAPNWLNTSHPRVRLVPHSTFFRNTSHLPTFSSPAIEANLHLIPGLSKEFLYFNDDVFLGAPVTYADFVSSRGYRVFTAWGAPSCAEDCINRWIGDGYCDQACNTELCKWDGGDCSQESPKSSSSISDALANAASSLSGALASYMSPPSSDASSSHYSSSNTYTPPASYPEIPPDAPPRAPTPPAMCSAGCDDDSIGNGVCDDACNVPPCGMDAGDCGIADVKRFLLGVQQEDCSWDRQVALPVAVQAIYLNFTGCFRPRGIRSASHDRRDGVRVAVVSQREQVMTIVFYPSPRPLLAHFTLQGRDVDDELRKVRATVYITPIMEVADLAMRPQFRLQPTGQSLLEALSSDAAAAAGVPQQQLDHSKLVSADDGAVGDDGAAFGDDDAQLGAGDAQVGDEDETVGDDDAAFEDDDPAASSEDHAALSQDSSAPPLHDSIADGGRDVASGDAAALDSSKQPTPPPGEPAAGSAPLDDDTFEELFGSTRRLLSTAVPPRRPQAGKALRRQAGETQNAGGRKLLDSFTDSIRFASSKLDSIVGCVQPLACHTRVTARHSPACPWRRAARRRRSARSLHMRP
eukprot:PLAT9421.1.p1 GENE.PLAT9421.1~~PLAT9421.1.p1  ORF type:complete len:787 (+),score=197.13 PLAT9421.1:32-2362(+)